MQVVKRDGRVMEFNKERIVNAIVKAMKQTSEGVDEELANKIAISIEKQLENRSEVSVYEIQDFVEKKLMVSSRKEVATAYITYRYTRDVARKSKTKNIFLDIITSKSNPLESKSDSYQNINDMMKNFASESIKPYVDTMLLSKEVLEAERAGYIDIRNKSYYPTKAVRTFQLPLTQDSKILKDCNNVECAVTKILSIVDSIQGEICESICIPAVDNILPPFVEKTYQEELQMMKEIFGEEVVNKEEKYYALAKKQSEKRLHHSLKFLFEGLFALHKDITFLDSQDDYSNGRGIVNAVALNLPRIMNYTKDTNVGLEPNLETNEDKIEKSFQDNIKKCVYIALKGMVERFHFQSTATKSQFPNLMAGLWLESEQLSEEDTLERVLKNGTLELEIWNLEEALKMLGRKENILKLRKEIINSISQILNEYSKEYGLNFTMKETNDNKNMEEKKHEDS